MFFNDFFLLSVSRTTTFPLKDRDARGESSITHWRRTSCGFDCSVLYAIERRLQYFGVTLTTRNNVDQPVKKTENKGEFGSRFAVFGSLAFTL